MAQGATVRVLVRNVESGRRSLEFSSFSLRELGLDFQGAREFFPDAMRNEWMLERHYDAIPPLPPIAEGWPGPFGGIPFDVEDTLLLLRLYRPGDLAFVGMHVQTPTSSGRQSLYRAISPLVTTSSHPFKFAQSDCIEWERFATPLRAAPQWNSSWFRVVRRWFLYAGGKEFNPNFQDDIDRVIDYITALEAALVPEMDFVSRRLRERAARLIALHDDAKEQANRLLKELYGIRSTLVHGSPLDERQMDLLKNKDQWWSFETLLRKVLVSALKVVPSDEPSRRSYLSSLYELSDQERAEKLVQDFQAIKTAEVKQDLLGKLNR